MTAIHQVLATAHPFETTTRFALRYRELFGEWGYDGRVHAGDSDPALDSAVSPVESLELEAADRDLILLHYSQYSAALEDALDLPLAKLLVYHGIVPPRYLWSFEPQLATLCAVGQERLATLEPRVAAAAATSDFCAGELRRHGFSDVTVVPALPDAGVLDLGAEEAMPFDDGLTNVLCVGALSPCHRHDEVIRAFALFQRHCEPGSRLVLVGDPVSPAYQQSLVRLAARLEVRDVVLTGGLPRADLNATYRASHVLLCLSEHEGSATAVMEAMHFGVPVITTGAGALRETVGDAGIVVDGGDLPTVAELIDLCAREDGLRRELAERGHRRLAALERERTPDALRTLVESIVGSA